MSSSECYDPSQGAWRAIASLPTARASGAAAVLDGKLYIAGGFITQSDQYSASVVRYDPANNSWETVAPMKIGRASFSAFAYNGKIYAIGGQTSGGRSTATECYDPTSNTWELVTSMDLPKARNGFALIAK